MGSSQKERMISMLKKLTALFLSLLLCLSLLPSQAGAMDDSKDKSPIQAEDMENAGSPENGDAPDRETAWTDDGNGGPGGAPLDDDHGDGSPWGRKGGIGGGGSVGGGH